MEAKVPIYVMSDNPGHLATYGMGSFETECGVITDFYCDIIVSIRTFLHMWDTDGIFIIHLLGSEQSGAYLNC